MNVESAIQLLGLNHWFLFRIHLRPRVTQSVATSFRYLVKLLWRFEQFLGGAQVVLAGISATIVVELLFAIQALLLTCLLLDVMSGWHLVEGVLRIRAKLDLAARNLRLLPHCRCWSIVQTSPRLVLVVRLLDILVDHGHALTLDGFNLITAPVEAWILSQPLCHGYRLLIVVAQIVLGCQHGRDRSIAVILHVVPSALVLYVRLHLVILVDPRSRVALCRARLPRTQYTLHQVIRGYLHHIWLSVSFIQTSQMVIIVIGSKVVFVVLHQDARFKAGGSLRAMLRSQHRREKFVCDKLLPHVLIGAQGLRLPIVSRWLGVRMGTQGDSWSYNLGLDGILNLCLSAFPTVPSGVSVARLLV